MERIGFLGMGRMGSPMAVNMLHAGFQLMVYNRTSARARSAVDAGAVEAGAPEEVFEWADTVVMMLSGPDAVSRILEPLFSSHPETLKGRVIINMGTNPPVFSRQLGLQLARAGAVFVDAPVSGTRVQAEDGTLLIMVSGPDDVVEPLSPLFQALGQKIIPCGSVPKAAMMKLAVNIVLSASISGLVEGAHFAKKSDLNLETFFRLILNGPLGNDIFAIKAGKILKGDFEAQASIATVREMLKHITDTAYEINAWIPNTLSNVNLITAAVNRGLSDEDACAILKVFGE
jgi:3-hydroxyisobutyrate dehydrogenase